MVSSVRIVTGSRLHFGPLANLAEQGRKFGGLGVMLEQPGFELVASAAATDDVQADEVWCERIVVARRRYLESATSGAPPVACRLELRDTIPPHIGLGSGTQLALAVAVACARLDGIPTDDPRGIAARVGRGTRSALGLFGFHHGGFLIDSGKAHDGAISPVAVRHEFPPDWRFVLITPWNIQGVSGDAEKQAFAELAPMSPATTAQLCQVALMRILPGVADAAFGEVADGLWEFGRIVGDYFAPGQGGRFADPRMSELVRYLRLQGIAGVGQTSWGPTLFALMPDTDSAEHLRNELTTSAWSDCRIRITAPRNRGADVSVIE